MKNKKKENLKYILIILCIAFIMPSVMYIILGNSILELNSDFNFFYFPKGVEDYKTIGNILFFTIFAGIHITYFFILFRTKKNKNDLFKNEKQIFLFIIIISILFTIVLPITSSDVFYYIGTGWSEAKYHVNPYKTSVEEVINENNLEEESQSDEMLWATPWVWRNRVVVYGPVWTFVCKILSGLSSGNLAVGLLLYKLFNLMLHIASCYFIYKITNKKVNFLLLYGLNPFILFNGLSNVHNDMLVLFFITLAIYILLKKKNIVGSIIILAIATATKYYAVLIIPFLVIYYYQNKTTGRKILYSLLLACLFLSVFFTCYLFYVQDGSFFAGIITQQNKFANSVFLLLSYYISIDIATKVAKMCMMGYILLYIFVIIKLLFSKKKRTFSSFMRKYNRIIIIVYIWNNNTISNLVCIMGFYNNCVAKKKNNLYNYKTDNCIRIF